MGKREKAYLGLGSNEGDRAFSLSEAVRRIKRIPKTTLLAVSPVYETSPLDVAGGFFLNAVAIIETGRDPHTLLYDLQRIESLMGRARGTKRQAARNIDIDLILYGGLVITGTELYLPHPRMSERRFVLEPLADLVPDLRIPGGGRTVSQAAADLRKRSPEQVAVKLGSLEQQLQIKCR